MLARHLLILLFITSPMFFSEISFGDPIVSWGTSQIAYQPFPGEGNTQYFPRTDLSNLPTPDAAQRGAPQLITLGTQTEQNALANLDRLQRVKKLQEETKSNLEKDLQQEKVKSTEKQNKQKITDLEKKIEEYKERLDEFNPAIKDTLNQDLGNGRAMKEMGTQQKNALQSAAGIVGADALGPASSSSPSEPRLNGKDLPKTAKWEVSSDGKTGQFTNAAGKYNHPSPTDYQNALDAYKQNPTPENSGEVMKQVRDLRQYNKATGKYDQWVGGGATGNGQFQHAFGTPGQTPSMVWDNGVGGTGSPSVRDFNAASGSSGSASDYSWFRRPVSDASVSSLSATDVYRTPFSSQDAALAQARATFPGGAIGELVRLQLPTGTDSNYYIVPRQFAATNRGIASSSTVPGTGLNTAPRCIPSGACITVAW